MYILGEIMKKIEVFSKIFEKIKSLKLNKKTTFCIVLAIICIVAFCYYTLSKNKLKETDESVSQTEYAQMVENKLTNIIKKIDGVDSVSVFVYTSGSTQTNYLMETTETENTNSTGSTKTITSKVVYEKSSGTTSPIITSTTFPKVIGVLVITNKINASTKVSIINSISTVLNIDSSCISILQERWNYENCLF